MTAFIVNLLLGLIMLTEQLRDLIYSGTAAFISGPLTDLLGFSSLVEQVRDTVLWYAYNYSSTLDLTYQAKEGIHSSPHPFLFRLSSSNTLGSSSPLDTTNLDL